MNPPEPAYRHFLVNARHRAVHRIDGSDLLDAEFDSLIRAIHGISFLDLDLDLDLGPSGGVGDIPAERIGQRLKNPAATSLNAPVQDIAAALSADRTASSPASPRQAVCRLDTAVMLSRVFLDGAPDPAIARPPLRQGRQPVPRTCRHGRARLGVASSRAATARIT